MTEVTGGDHRDPEKHRRWGMERSSSGAPWRLPLAGTRHSFIPRLPAGSPEDGISESPLGGIAPRRELPPPRLHPSQGGPASKHWPLWPRFQSLPAPSQLQRSPWDWEALVSPARQLDSSLCPGLISSPLRRIPPTVLEWCSSKDSP